MFLDEDTLEKLWDDSTGKSISDSLRPLQEGEGLGFAYVEKIADNLGLIVGNLALSRFEDRLSESWGKCFSKDVLAFRFMSAFYTLIQDGAKQFSADIILIDVGPNLGAINRAAMIATDQVVFPLVADMFSIQGLKNLGPTLQEWREEWKELLQGKAGDVKFPLPRGTMQPAGYVVMQHAAREGRPVKAYQRWVSRIPTDPNTLALLKHYRSLMPMAQEHRKPIFFLKPADGAIGSHYQAVQECYGHFLLLAKRVAANANMNLQ
jgi:cellulose biosynthesis protein BcsQ